MLQMLLFIKLKQSFLNILILVRTNLFFDISKIALFSDAIILIAFLTPTPFPSAHQR